MRYYIVEENASGDLADVSCLQAAPIIGFEVGGHFLCDELIRLPSRLVFSLFSSTS